MCCYKEIQSINFKDGGYILLPEDESKKYPVVYMFHGTGGCDEWISEGKANIRSIVEELTETGRMEPMILVMPRILIPNSSNLKNPNMDLELIEKSYNDFFNYPILDLIDCVNMKFKGEVKTGCENTAIAGFSMGATAAIHHAGQHKDKFYHLGAISVSSRTSEFVDLDDYKLYRIDDAIRFIGYGTAEGNEFVKADKHCIENYTNNDLIVIMDTIDGGNHSFCTFNPLLKNFLTMIFKN